MNSHHGEKTFSPWWKNFLIGVKKLFHHGEISFSSYVIGFSAAAKLWVVPKQSSDEVKRQIEEEGHEQGGQKVDCFAVFDVENAQSGRRNQYASHKAYLAHKFF